MEISVNLCIWGGERHVSFSCLGAGQMHCILYVTFNAVKLFLNTYWEKPEREKDSSPHDAFFWMLTPLRTDPGQKYHFRLLVTLPFDGWKKRTVVTWPFHVENLVIQCGHFFLSAVSSLDAYIILLKEMEYDFYRWV